MKPQAFKQPAKPANKQVMLLADLVPIGGGEYKIVPQKPTGAEVTPKQAAAFLGISRPSVYRLCEEDLIDHRRPTRRKLLISMDSLKTHREANKDAEYWDSRRKAKKS